MPLSFTVLGALFDTQLHYFRLSEKTNFCHEQFTYVIVSKIFLTPINKTLPKGLAQDTGCKTVKLSDVSFQYQQCRFIRKEYC